MSKKWHQNNILRNISNQLEKRMHSHSSLVAFQKQRRAAGGSQSTRENKKQRSGRNGAA